MYEYTWYQWLTFFFIYCFFGWIFESTYVSAKTGHFVNRGFLRLPLLPLYGTGAVMMLWVSLPVKDNLFLVYLAGVIAATILEYVTGWGMEKLFKMKYWDYSNQRFNVKGYICLSSSIAWGFLTIFLTEVVHRPIEHYVLGLPVMVNIIFVLITSLLFAADTAESVKTALDLAKVLDAMTDMRAELDDIQVQMALLKAETSERVAEAREEAAARLSRMKSGAAVHAAALKDDTAERLNELVENTMEITEDAAARVSGTLAQRTEGSRQAIQRDELNKSAVQDRKDKLAALSQRLVSITEKRHMLSTHMDFYRRGILKGNPTASSSRFAEALKELREIADRKNSDEHDAN